MGFGYSGGVERVDDVRSLPTEGKPNSRKDLYKNGERIQSRWYDANGNPARNRDYSNHGNPAKHPIVPHDHDWIDGNRSPTWDYPSADFK